MSPSIRTPIWLTFYSDFGTNYFLLNNYKQLFPPNLFYLLDITHHLQRYNYAHAAHVIKSSLKIFKEKKTWHLLFFDIFNTHPDSDFFIYLPYNDSHIICPNNGLANYLFQSDFPSYIPISINKKSVPLENIFLSLYDFIIHFEERKQTLLSISYSDKLLSDKKPITPFLYDNKLECKIITVDDFNNIILNCTQEKFEEARAGRNFKIYLMKPEKTSTDNCITKISNGYNDVKNGETVAFFNTSGYLELAINQGSLAPLLGYSEYTLEAIRKNSENIKRLFYEPITIYFTDK